MWKILRESIFILIICFGFIVVPMHRVLSIEEKEKYNILIVTSRNSEENKKNLEDIISNIEKEVTNYNLNFYIECIEYIEDDNYIENYKKMFDSRYSLEEVSYIGAIDDEAFDIVRDIVSNENNKLYKTPIIFSEVIEDKAITFEERSFITGKYCEDNIKELLELIFELNGSVENINLIASDSKFSNSTIESLNKYNEELGANLNIIQDSDITNLDQYSNDIVQSENTVNIVCGDFKNKDNKNIIYKNVINYIKDNLNGPIYTNDLVYLHEGILGACISSMEDYMEYIKDVVIENLENKSIEEIPIAYEEYYNKYIDYISVYLSREALGRVPEDSIFINNSLRDIYKMIRQQPIYKISVSIMVFMLVAFICLIEYILNLKRKKNTERLLLEERKKVQTDFLAIVNHEFRTPINIILNSSNLIKSNISNTEYVFNKLDGINNNSYRLYRLINNLLYIMKIENGTEKLKLESINIVEVVEDVVQEVVKYSSKKNIDLIFDTEEEEIITSIDIVAMQRVMLNLLSNSIKFTKSEGKIQVFVAIEDDKVKIKVVDNGIGVKEEYLELMFTKFYQVSPALTRNSEGGGIGLYVVKKIIELHKGNIEFTSEFNVGSMVTITLPLTKECVSRKFVDDMMTIEEIAKIEMSDLIHY
ncbi:HAMP domain-containing sensor histidine kinase [uncultured Clostridium sp.]|uniref:sensor histidine kinase n=1 Tax=uncultured Clostridium sp. TaxID=59620 RepID=UPI002600D4AD|nr:HAMP domain-containing sensor histidine kinase [uncultured Clostridium sp.]